MLNPAWDTVVSWLACAVCAAHDGKPLATCEETLLRPWKRPATAGARETEESPNPFALIFSASAAGNHQAPVPGAYGRAALGWGRRRAGTQGAPSTPCPPRGSAEATRS